MSKDLALQQTEWDLHENPESFIPLEFTEEVKPELYGLEPKEANQLVGGIDVITAELKVLKDAYVDVIELEITSENLPIFKDLRKNFTKNRTSREKLRKAKKSYFLNGGRFVDAIFKNIDAECDLMESKLLDAEKFFENQAKQKAKDLNDARIEKLRPFVEDVTGLDFSEFSEEDFDDYVVGKKTRFDNAKKEAEAEVLRIETERLAEIERQKAIKIENAKLKDDAEKAEAKRKIEADKQAKIQVEKDAEIKRLSDIQKETDRLVKIESDKKDAIIAKQVKDAKDIADNLAKVESDRIAKAEADKKAPIKKQLENWVGSLELPLPPVENATSKDIKEKFEAFKKWSINQVNNL